MKNITQEIRSLYNRIDIFEIPTLTFPLSKNPLTTAKNAVLNVKDTFRFKKFIRNLIRDIDVICISCFREYFANLMTKEAKGKARLVALRMADQKLEEINFVRRPFLSFLLNIKNFLFGYSTFDYKFDSQDKNVLIAKNFRNNPYEETIAITDHGIGERKSFIRLPPPFISLRQIHQKDEELPAILVAGDKTPFYKGWTASDENKYADFFDYLRNNFSGCKLYFKPKIGRTDPTKYNLSGFEVLSPETSLEEVCLRKNIKKVIAIRSTSAKVGAYFGIPAYLLYPMFDISNELRLYLDSYFDDMKNSIVKVKDLEDLNATSNTLLNEYTFDKLASLYREAIVT